MFVISTIVLYKRDPLWSNDHIIYENYAAMVLNENLKNKVNKLKEKYRYFIYKKRMNLKDKQNKSNSNIPLKNKRNSLGNKMRNRRVFFLFHFAI